MTPRAAAALAALDLDVLDSVASRLDLRPPNRDAVHTVALHLENFYAEPREGGEFFEGVVDAATGLGKTYVTAGLLDYYVTMGLRNFAIITPGQTIQRKTVNQFTRGHEKSLVDYMAATPLVIHSENFDSSRIAAELDNPDRVKLFVFTVQSLLKPKLKANRKTHTFREGLGKAFYDHLDGLDDLVVFADEHHAYFGDKFSQAIRGLTPLALIGLTATPDEKKLAKQGIPVIFRYPLIAAIGEKYVKTPVIVGRKDDRVDEKTQLLDAGALLNAKERALAAYCASSARVPVHAVLLVTCRDIAHATETVASYEAISITQGSTQDPGSSWKSIRTQTRRRLSRRSTESTTRAARPALSSRWGCSRRDGTARAST